MVALHIWSQTAGSQVVDTSGDTSIAASRTASIATSTGCVESAASVVSGAPSSPVKPGDPLQAATLSVNAMTKLFRWIAGSDPMGARQMCEEVTMATCPLSISESASPYRVASGSAPSNTESPVGAAVTVHYALSQRARMGETNPDFRLIGGRVIAFFVTDEPGSAMGTEANDWSDYFSRTVDPQANLPWGGTNYNTGTLRNIVSYFQRNEILTFGMVPSFVSRPCTLNDSRDLPRCVIEANRGAVIPIASATDAEVSAAFTRIVDAVAGGTSQFVLHHSPITSTIKVRVRDTDVPRSRANGFDYDPVSRAIVFYGSQYQPHEGDAVVVSYRVWGGSVG